MVKMDLYGFVTQRVYKWNQFRVKLTLILQYKMGSQR